MPRRSRLDQPGLPQHVIQRGNNRGASFFADGDYNCYLHWLRKAAYDHGVDVHAYVLMTNHVHLLATPAKPGAMATMMQCLVVSPGHEEQAIFTMPGGQSGHPLSPFYGAGHNDWLQGKPTPLLAGETRHTLQLMP